MINTDEASKLATTVKDTIFQDNPDSNISKSERIISLATGTFILFRGLSNIISSPLLGFTELAVAGGLIYRGSTGFCAVTDFVEREPEGIVITENYLVDNI